MTEAMEDTLIKPRGYWDTAYFHLNPTFFSEPETVEPVAKAEMAEPEAKAETAVMANWVFMRRVAEPVAMAAGEETAETAVMFAVRHLSVRFKAVLVLIMVGPWEAEERSGPAAPAV